MQNLVCWSCGASLRDIPLPFARLQQCKQCGVDLHVCRQCRFYNPDISDKCDHDMAEPARDISVANFCHYFRAAANTFVQNKKSRSDQALQKLKSLFGEDGNGDESADNRQSGKSESGSAREKFDSLFKKDES